MRRLGVCMFGRAMLLALKSPATIVSTSIVLSESRESKEQGSRFPAQPQGTSKNPVAPALRRAQDRPGSRPGRGPIVSLHQQVTKNWIPALDGDPIRGAGTTLSLDVAYFVLPTAAYSPSELSAAATATIPTTHVGETTRPTHANRRPETTPHRRW